MKNEFIIYSKWLAYELRMQGYKLIRTEVNRNFPQFICWVFEDSADLQHAIRTTTEQRKNQK